MANLESTEELLLSSNVDGLDTSEPAVQKSALASFFSNLDVLRQISMIIGLLIVLAIVAILWSWGKEADFRPLGTYKTDELISTLDFLDKHEMNYKLEGNSVLVVKKFGRYSFLVFH